MNPFIGEIRMFCGKYAPVNWMFCDGSSLAISQYDALFNLIGTTYGGDGVQNFNLPDLRGRVPVHIGAAPGRPSYNIGQVGGFPGVTLTPQNLPAHTHASTFTYTSLTQPSASLQVQATPAPGTTNQPQNHYLAGTQKGSPTAKAFVAAGAGATQNIGGVSSTFTGDPMGNATITITTAGGGSQPLPTASPSLAVAYIIAVVGIYPSQS